MRIRLVVVLDIEQSRDIDILHIVRLFLHQREKLLIIHREISVLLCKEITLVRHDGKINVYILIRHVFVIEISESLRCPIDRAFIHRIFELCSISVFDINIVVILLPEHIESCKRFERAEPVAQRKLVERVILKVRHEIAR